MSSNYSESELTEIWKDIPNFEGYYQASSLGRLKALKRNVGHYLGGTCYKRERILKPKLSEYGYLHIELQKCGKSKYTSVHRLVATTFLPNPNNKPEVNHKDGNKANNQVDNLEWVTESENIQHAFDTGLKSAQKGEEAPWSKLTENIVRSIHQRITAGEMQKDIAADLHVSKALITLVKQRKLWGHVQI